MGAKIPLCRVKVEQKCCVPPHEPTHECGSLYSAIVCVDYYPYLVSFSIPIFRVRQVC